MSRHSSDAGLAVQSSLSELACLPLQRSRRQPVEPRRLTAMGIAGGRRRHGHGGGEFPNAKGPMAVSSSATDVTSVVLPSSVSVPRGFVPEPETQLF